VPRVFDRQHPIRCRVCRCTERKPCNPPCSWVDQSLCSSCYKAVCAILDWSEGGLRPNMAALRREVEADAAPLRYQLRVLWARERRYPEADGGTVRKTGAK
jgi:hypothetical protein